MARYIATRIVWIFILLFTILSVTFVLLKLAPSYPPTTEDQRSVYYEKQVADGYMSYRRVSDEEELTTLRGQIVAGTAMPNAYYVDKGEFIRAYEPVPISQQYFVWVKNIVTKFDWGLSTKVEVGRPVFDIIGDRIGTTMTLNLIALVFYIPIGLVLGIIAALNKNTATDNIISILVMVMISVPSFVVIILLVMILGYNLDWAPTIYPAKDALMSVRIRGLLIPVMALAFGPIAGLTRMTRAELTEVLTSEFLLLARTKGLTKRQAVVRHAMRNSMVPLVPSIIYSFIGILSGSVIMEIIYAIPGTGQVYIKALSKNAYDYNLLLANSGLYTAIGLVAILVIDITYGIIDPRIRMGGKR